jgi:hypothetical protein
MKINKNYNYYLNWLRKKVSIHKDDSNGSSKNSKSSSSGVVVVNNNKPSSTITTTAAARTSKSMTVNARILSDSFIKLDPRYLAKDNPVMFTVEVGFMLVLAIAFFPNISTEFVNGN